MVVLMTDEHNPFISSLHGHPFVQTPNMDRLAARGTHYENTYCPSPLCHPSRSSFFTGRRVHELQTYSNCNHNTTDHPTYGAVLREQGVHTVHIGKTDGNRHSSELGFSEIIDPVDRVSPGDLNFVRSPIPEREGGADRAKGWGIRKAPHEKDNNKIQAALDWLSDTRPTVQGPWVLVVQVVRPHFPHKTTQELWDLYPNGDDLPEHGVEQASAQHPYAQDLRMHFETNGFSEENVRGLRHGYYGCVSYVDRQLGRVMEALEGHGILDDTVLAFTSDHGEMLGKFGLWWKCSLYEDSARVPMIVSGPGFAAGARATTSVDLLDLQASMFHATGRARPAEWTGVPLQEIPLDDADRVGFSEYHGHGTRSGGYLIRKGDWKLMYCMEAPHMLFNLAEDPHELNNLAESAPDKLAELEAELRKICDPDLENDRAHSFEDKLKKELHEVVPV
jgi:choline-sulfatase